ncbi:MAG: P-II family nitrogen regulator [Rhizobiales bacterium]|nr:P-II family nitrogen regulator [Hyphomicrobiales bacterium]
MKLITAIIKPHKLDTVREALSAIEVTGLTVTEVKGYGRQRGQSEIYRGAEYSVNFVPKLKLEIAVEAARVEAIIEAIKTAAGSGEIGDGKIFVTSLEQAVRIRTGETNENAL